MRGLLRYCWILFLYCTGILWWTKRRLRGRNAVVVLTFHRVLNDGEFQGTSSLPGIIVRTDTFSALARYLSSRCRPVRPDRLLNGYAEQDSRIPVIVTFDDGWKDNALNAFPVARQYEIPITIFICPSLQGRDFPFWPESAVAWWRQSRSEAADPLPARFATAEDFVEFLKAQMPADREAMLADAIGRTASGEIKEPGNAAMTWADMRDLSEGGVIFGSHTDTHALLPQLNRTEIEGELINSKTAIQNRLQTECSMLSYPNGDVSPIVCSLTRQVGYTMAFTTMPGAFSPGSNPLLIPRINVWEGKVTGPAGRFSRAAFEYSVFWKAARAGFRNYES